MFLFGLLSIKKIYKEMERITMKIHTFKLEVNGERFTRTEWGKTRKSALRTLWGIYGRENVLVLA